MTLQLTDLYTRVLILKVHLFLLQLRNPRQRGSFSSLLRLQGSFLGSCLSSQLVHHLQQILATAAVQDLKSIKLLGGVLQLLHCFKQGEYSQQILACATSLVVNLA